MKSILILGGTGAMGKHIVQLLIKKENEVYVTSRSKREDIGNIKYILGNAKDDAFLKETLSLKQWDVIVDFMIYNTKQFVARHELLLSSCKQYIFLSSSRVYADTQPMLNESSPRLLDVCKDAKYLATDEYALSKAREENVLLKSKYQNWTIIRPYITYSEQRLQLGVLEKEYWLYQALHNRTIVFSEDIAEKTTTLTYGYDVARGIVSLMGKDNALGRIFHITVPEYHKWQEIFDMYIRVLSEFLGEVPKIKMIALNPRMRLRNDSWQVKYDRYYNRRFDNGSINEFIDTSSFTPTLVGMEACLRDFLKHPTFRIDGWTQFSMYDRITGEWFPLSEIPTWKDRIKYLLRRTILPAK